MRSTFILSFFIFIFSFSFSQSFQPTVIGSAGAEAVSVNGSMAWTIGEVFTETYASGSNFFTQGFHQPDTSAGLAVTDIPSENISIFPNPVIDNLVLDFSGATGSHAVYLYDLQGKLLMLENISADKKRSNIMFRDFASGMYFLSIVNEETYSRSSYKINKTE